jgi:hypothetical protein
MKFKYLPLLLNIELGEPEVAPLFHSFYLKHIFVLHCHLTYYASSY